MHNRDDLHDITMAVSRFRYPPEEIRRIRDALRRIEDREIMSLRVFVFGMLVTAFIGFLTVPITDLGYWFVIVSGTVLLVQYIHFHSISKAMRYVRVWIENECYFRGIQ